MDPLSVTANIIAILQLSSKVLGYLNDIKDAPEECKKFTIEASNIYSLLTSLRFRLEESSDEPWHRAVRNLGVENGPLDQFKQALEQIQSKIVSEGKLKKVADALIWKFRKEEVISILDSVDRLKTLVLVALELDHLLVSPAPLRSM